MQVKPNWAGAQTAEDVGRLLKSKYPNLEIVGFNDEYDIRAVREFAEAIDDMLTKYPEVEVIEVSIRRPPPPPNFDDAFAWATGYRTGKGYMSTAISLNGNMATDWQAYLETMQGCWDARWIFRGVPGKPVYSTMIHEFGHAMDYAANEAAHENTDRVLYDAWQRMAPDANYRDWLRQQMSQYSFIDGDNDQDVEPWEVLAEAFADVELNGMNASDSSKALHRLMVDALNTIRGD